MHLFALNNGSYVNKCYIKEIARDFTTTNHFGTGNHHTLLLHMSNTKQFRSYSPSMLKFTKLLL